LKKLNSIIGNITAVLLLLMMTNVFLDVILRYFFNTGSIALQEMEWHFFAVMFLFGISYALSDESHVRVDFIYDSLSKRKRAIINIIGTLFMLIPFALLIAYGSYEFVYDAYDMNEISEDPGGLTHRWIIKAMIPLSLIFLIITSIGYIYRNYQVIKNHNQKVKS
jgi:TRAP-type mannitol/chloroaromatic compound transport system permease small subunit